MIFDIYEQPDLFKIAKCGRQKTLVAWLNNNHIPHMRDSKNQIIAHKRAVESSLGVEHNERPDDSVKLWLGDNAA